MFLYFQESPAKKNKKVPAKSFLTPMRSNSNGNSKSNATPRQTISPSALTEKVTNSANRAKITLAKFSAEVN